MEHSIKYTQTSDSVNLAYWTAGEGRPLLVMAPPGMGHAELIWQLFAPALKPLAASFHVAGYDSRGTGLSDRQAVDFSMPAMIRDLEAIVERTGFESFVVAAWNPAVPIAVTYAVAHADLVSHLVLVDGFATPSDFTQIAAYRASVPLLETELSLLTETFGQVLWGHLNPEFGRAFAAYMRACSDLETFRAVWASWESYDVAGLLPDVTVPTLVIQNKNSRWVPQAIGQRIAASIPRARFALVDDVTYASTPDLIKEFVLGTQRTPSVSPDVPSGTAIILFADIVDSTALTERLGDDAFRAKARDLDATLRTVIREHAGTAIEGKLLGDGVLAVFTSARQAIEGALACARAGDEAGLPLHLGIHAGDVSREKDPDGRSNVYGGAVNIAARISALSAPGEVLVSETVRSLARTSAGVRFEDRGEQALKGVGEAVRVWAVLETE
jgi:class 3 adenylate cyclase